MFIEAAEQSEYFEHREFFGQLRFLQLNAEAGTQPRFIGVPRLAQNAHGAGVGRVQAFADFDGGCLAGAVRAKETKTLARADTQVEPVHGNDIAVRLAESGDFECELC